MILKLENCLTIPTWIFETQYFNVDSFMNRYNDVCQYNYINFKALNKMINIVNSCLF